METNMAMGTDRPWDSAGITTMQLFDDQWIAQTKDGAQFYGETEDIAAMCALSAVSSPG